MNKPAPYDHLHRDVAGLIEQGRQASARTVNAVMTATYWLVGQRIVEFEQGLQLWRCRIAPSVPASSDA